MATQTSTRPIALLLAATILTSICALGTGVTHSSELAKHQATIGLNRVGVGAIRGDSISVDGVNEARWAKPQQDY